jgi:hypothetical protein
MNTSTKHYVHLNYSMKKSTKQNEGLWLGVLWLAVFVLGFIIVSQPELIVTASEYLYKAVTLEP